MRERSHEIGRRQLLGVIKLITRQSSERVPVVEIGTAYGTAMRTRFAALHQPKREVVFDGVIAFRFSPDHEISCLIESKAANTKSSIAKLPAHLAEFVIRAYCVQAAWSDRLSGHRPLFLFAAGAAFDSELLRGGRLDRRKVGTMLKQRLPGRTVDENVLARVCDFTRVLVYDDWLDELIG